MIPKISSGMDEFEMRNMYAVDVPKDERRQNNPDLLELYAGSRNPIIRYIP